MMARLQGILLALVLLAPAGVAAHGHGAGSEAPTFEQAQDRLDRECDQCRVGGLELAAAAPGMACAEPEATPAPRVRAPEALVSRFTGHGPRAPPFSS